MGNRKKQEQTREPQGTKAGRQKRREEQTQERRQTNKEDEQITGGKNTKTGSGK